MSILGDTPTSGATPPCSDAPNEATPRRSRNSSNTDPITDLFDDPVNYEIPPEPIASAAEAYALDQADYHLRCIAAIDAERVTIAEAFDREMERLKARRADRLAKYDAKIEWHTKPLRELHAALLAEDPRRKTIHLPHGTLKSRTATEPVAVVDDMAALVEWAQVNAPVLLPPRERVALTDLRKAVHLVARAEGGWIAVDVNGEVVPGVTARIPPVQFTAIPTAEGDMFDA